MRVIKFRAWEPETEMGKPGNMSYNQAFCFSQIIHPDGVVVEQFTGLLDKNSKEIYEGDIVEWNSKKWVINWNKKNCQYFLQDMLSIKELIPCGEWHFCRERMEKHSKVVGNIHENLDLLS
jgi:glutathione peroxidase-family protein